MREKLLSTLCAAGILLCGMLGHRTEAMTLAAQDGAAAQAAIVQQVVNVCGMHGCVQVQTKRVIHHQKSGNTVPHHI
jgi:hypothetical protein